MQTAQQITEQQLKSNIEYLKAEEDKLIASLAKEHQIVDAERLLETLHKRCAYRKMLDEIESSRQEASN